MVDKAGGYFGCPFKGYQCVTQGDPLSPTIFYVVVDAVIRHWVTVVTPIEEDTRGIGLTRTDLTAYFYANNGLVESTQTERQHKAFDVPAGLFDRVVLWTNTANTVCMLCQPCRVPGGMSEEAYV